MTRLSRLLLSAAFLGSIVGCAFPDTTKTPDPSPALGNLGSLNAADAVDQSGLEAAFREGSSSSEISRYEGRTLASVEVDRAFSLRHPEDAQRWMIAAAAQVESVVLSDGFRMTSSSDPSREAFRFRFDQNRPDGRRSALVVRSLLLPLERTAEGQNFRWLLWADELAVIVPKD